MYRGNKRFKIDKPFMTDGYSIKWDDGVETEYPVSFVKDIINFDPKDKMTTNKSSFDRFRSQKGSSLKSHRQIDLTV